MQLVEAIIFDIGGVLWRSSGFRMSDKWLARTGLDVETFDQIVFASEWGEQALVGEITEAQQWQNIGRKLNLSPADTQEMMDDSWTGRWDTELLDYIRTLKPHYKLGILSDASHGTRERIQEWVNEALFEVIVISAEEGIRKPQPQIYQSTLDRLGVEASAAIFIDDRVGNVEGARQLGMQAILYTEFAPFLEEFRPYLDG